MSKAIINQNQVNTCVRVFGFCGRQKERAVFLLQRILTNNVWENIEIQHTLFFFWWDDWLAKLLHIAFVHD